MALSPTTTYLNAHVEQPNAVTKHLKFYPVSFEAIELNNASAAGYTKTVGSVAVGEFRPFSIITLALTASGTLNATNVITLDKANRAIGDVIRIVFPSALITTGKTITIKDDAATPATLITLDDNDSDVDLTSTREFILTSAGTWTAVGIVPPAV